MIPSSSALVSLKPARQAALQAIMAVEEARQRGARLPSMPHVRTFLRLLTGCSRRETPEHIRVAERWQVPNKLADRSSV
ncbi:plasmid SOS inhibition protein A [Klebsiella pneumoniae]|nr:plasmid SOS inhibition protein A [Klebsiella pneumoniae]